MEKQMRSIKLREILSSEVDDEAILTGLTASIALPAPTRRQILKSYVQYEALRGSNAITPLGLGVPWPDTFSELYSGRTQKSGLHWIDEIATTTRYGYCPMCGSETHKTVDHFLPRKPWAEFSFLSINLVPSCGTCNTKRGNRASSPTSPHRLLHPYYDYRLLTRRLHITKISPPFVAPRFEFDVCVTVSAKNRPRVEYHLDQSVDAVEYQQYCINRWSEARLSVRRCTTLAMWIKWLKNHREDAETASGPNSWRTAFYAGLLARQDAIKWLFTNRNAP
jgi:hypothetical protein